MNPRDLRGTNHLPCNATGSHNFRVFVSKARGGSWDPEVYAAELAYIKGLGFRQLRLFWSPFAWFIHRAEFVQIVGQAAQMIKEAGLEVQLVCMDGICASPRWLSNPLLTPWYDLLGTFGTDSWDPTALTNPSLMNGSTGLFDGHVAYDAADFATQFPAAVEGWRAGGWVTAPDPIYVNAYEMPNYPAVPAGHETLWNGYVAALDAAIGAFHSRGILHSLDLCNEPTFTLGFAALTAALTAIGAFAPGAGMDPNPAVYGVQAQRRCAKFLKWMQSYAAAKWPSVPTTMGHITFEDLALVHTWGENPSVAVDVPPTSFFSFHAYGNGRYQRDAIKGFRQLLANERPAWLNIPLTCNEYGRWEQGEDMLPHMLYTCVQEGVGLIIWDVLEWPSFGSAFSADHVPGGAPPTGNGYPFTGLARSVLDGETLSITARRPDILGWVKEWASLRPLKRPQSWQTRRVAKCAFEIYDPATGNPLFYSPSMKVYWRWAYVPKGTIPAFSETSPAWRTLEPFADFRCLGTWLDVPDMQIVEGYASHALPIEVLTGLPATHDLVVQPAFGRPDYEIASWEQLQWNEVGYLLLSFAEVWAWGQPPLSPPEQAESDLARVYNALMSRTRAHLFPMISADPDRAEFLEEGVYARPTSVTIGEGRISAGLKNPRPEYGILSEEWTLSLRFAERVSLRGFVQSITRILLPQTTDGPQITLKITGEVDVTTPVLQSQTSGTEATITFEVTSP